MTTAPTEHEGSSDVVLREEDKLPFDTALALLAWWNSILKLAGVVNYIYT